MKKLILLFILGSFTATLLQAQNTKRSSNPVNSDPLAKSILDKMSAKFRSYKGVTAEFSVNIETAAGEKMGVNKGKVFMKGDKFKLVMGKDQVICDGQNVWSYAADINEVHLTKADPEAKQFTPQKLFSASYGKEYLSKYNGERKVGTKTIQEIELTPTDKSKSYFKILLHIDKAASTLYGARVMESSGMRYLYNVVSIQGSSSLPDTHFIFDKSKFPGVEVIDLR